MAGLISDAEILGARAALEIVLVHRCTITPRVAGATDAENNVTLTDGTPVTNVPCIYEPNARVARDTVGATAVAVPSLTVSASTTIAAGSKVTAITDQLGGVLAAGPFMIERILDATAGLGAPLLPSWELRGADVLGES